MGEAWEELSSKKDMVIRSFRKCGISLPIDGSKDEEINIDGLENYVVESDSEANDADPDNNAGDSDVVTDDEDPFDDL